MNTNVYNCTNTNKNIQKYHSMYNIIAEGSLCLMQVNTELYFNERGRSVLGFTRISTSF